MIYKNLAVGINGMIASANPLATLSGIRTLIEGGNAVDAALATSAALSVVAPHMCGLGGDFFALIYDSNKNLVRFINGSGYSGSKANLQFFKDNGYENIPVFGPLPITVPGMVSAWTELYKNYGTLELKNLLRYAVDYAKNGFPISYHLSENIKNNSNVLKNSEYLKNLFLKDPEPGNLIKQKSLSQTLLSLTENGFDEFYKGSTGQKITGFLEESGALITNQDIKNYRATWDSPIKTSYRSFTVYETPPNTQGIAASIMLNIMDSFDLSKLTEWQILNLIIESKKFAFDIRDRYITDPKFMKTKIEKFLDEEYVKNFKELTQYKKRKSNTTLTGDTVYFAVVDKDLNAVSAIQSLYYSFGSKVADPGTGIIFHNRGALFSLDPNNINVIAPNKRTRHTLIASMMFKDSLSLVLGAAGADAQPQSHVQVIHNIVDRNMNIQEAIEYPRLVHGKILVSDKDEGVRLEKRFSQRTINALRNHRQDVNVTEELDPIMGDAQGIMILEKKRLLGGSDPRRDGLALGF